MFTHPLQFQEEQEAAEASADELEGEEDSASDFVIRAVINGHEFEEHNFTGKAHCIHCSEEFSQDSQVRLPTQTERQSDRDRQRQKEIGGWRKGRKTWRWKMGKREGQVQTNVSPLGFFVAIPHRLRLSSPPPALCVVSFWFQTYKCNLCLSNCHRECIPYLKKCTAATKSVRL